LAESRSTWEAIVALRQEHTQQDHGTLHHLQHYTTFLKAASSKIDEDLAEKQTSKSNVYLQLGQPESSSCNLHQSALRPAVESDRTYYPIIIPFSDVLFNDNDWMSTTLRLLSRHDIDQQPSLHILKSIQLYSKFSSKLDVVNIAKKDIRPYLQENPRTSPGWVTAAVKVMKAYRGDKRPLSHPSGLCAILVTVRPESPLQVIPVNNPAHGSIQCIEEQDHMSDENLTSWHDIDTLAPKTDTNPPSYLDIGRVKAGESYGRLETTGMDRSRQIVTPGIYSPKERAAPTRQRALTNLMSSMANYRVGRKTKAMYIKQSTLAAAFQNDRSTGTPVFGGQQSRSPARPTTILEPGAIYFVIVRE